MNHRNVKYLPKVPGKWQEVCILLHVLVSLFLFLPKLFFFPPNISLKKAFISLINFCFLPKACFLCQKHIYFWRLIICFFYHRKMYFALRIIYSSFYQQIFPYTEMYSLLAPYKHIVLSTKYFVRSIE